MLDQAAKRRRLELGARALVQAPDVDHDRFSCSAPRRRPSVAGIQS
jgi:hypothetical protein